VLNTSDHLRIKVACNLAEAHGRVRSNPTLKWHKQNTDLIMIHDYQYGTSASCKNRLLKIRKIFLAY